MPLLESASQSKKQTLSEVEIYFKLFVIVFFYKNSKSQKKSTQQGVLVSSEMTTEVIIQRFTQHFSVKIMHKTTIVK